MGIISEVKCYRCDRRYSGFRSRCPYCGARRSKRGKRAADTGNNKGKLIIGILLLVILIVAVIVLISQTIPKGDDTAVTTPTPSFSDDEGVTSVTSEPTPTVDPTSTPTVDPETVQSVEIQYLGKPKTDITLQLTESLQLKAAIVPADSTETPVWTSDDEDVVVVLQSGKITAVGSGHANITVTVGDVTAECIVRVP